MNCLRNHVWCRIPLMSFLSGMSHQYDASIGKQLTRRFLPVLPEKYRKYISFIFNGILDIALCRTHIFSSLLSEGHDKRIQARTSTTADEKCLYKKSFIIAKSLLLPCCSSALSTRRNAPKHCPFCASHLFYALMKLSSKT